MKTKFVSGFLFMIALLFSACEKGPGEGGTSTIRGKVIIREYNGDFTILRDVYPGAKEDVYIIYGDDYVYGDKFETNYDGNYEFDYLLEGSYKVFAYSKDTNNLITSERIPIIREVEITDKNQVVEVPDIIIAK